MKKLLVSLVIGILLSKLSYASTQFSDISTQWVGLLPEKDKLKYITVNWEESSPEEPTQGAQGSIGQQRVAIRAERARTANRGQAQALQFGGGQPIVGQIIIDVATLDASMPLIDPQAHPLSGEFFPKLNLIKFQYHPPRDQPKTFFGAMNEEKTQMYVVFGGALGATMPPFVLVAGNTLPDTLLGIADSREVIEEARLSALQYQLRDQQIQQEMDDLRSELQQARASGDAERVNQLRQQIGDLSIELSQNNADKMRLHEEFITKQNRRQQKKSEKISSEMNALNAEIIKLQTLATQARRVGNHDEADAVAQKLHSLRVRQQDIAGGRHAVLREKAGGGCMSSLKAWLGEIAEQGGPSARVSQPTQLLNLFRPTVFSRYFEKPLFRMDHELREGYKYELARVCPRDETLEVRNSDLNVIASGFGEARGVFNYIGAGIGGLALDGVSEWQARTASELATKGNPDALSEFQVQSHYMLSALWPNESIGRKTMVADAIETAKTSDIFAEVDARVKQAQNGNLKDLLAAVEPRTLTSWFSTDLGTQDKVRQYISAQLPELLTNYFAKNKLPAYANYSSPRQALIASKAWYEQNKDLFVAFNTQPAIKQMLDELYVQRDASYSALYQILEAEIADAVDLAELNEVGADVYIRPDKRHSKAWQRVAQAKTRRLEELEQLAYVARVGEGPLNAGDEGAVYINALYRGDFGIIAEEDKKFAASMVEMSEPLLNSGIFELASFFSNSPGDAHAAKQAVRDRIKGISMSSAMTGLFIVMYEHLAPRCLGPVPVDFERTVFWENITRNLLGDEIYRNTFSRTYYYTIAQRHADLFSQLGQEANAGNLEALGTIYGKFGLISQDVQKSIFVLSDNLRGVTRMMQQYECDSEEMKTFEEALIGITRSRL